MRSPDTANNRLRIPALLVINLFISCTIVKENRDSCPCNLVVEITGVRDTPATLLVQPLRDSACAEILSFSRDTLLTMFVPRGGVSLSAWTTTASGSAVLIPYGSEAPPLYFYHGVVDAAGEVAYADITLRKQFCTVSLEVEGPPGWGPPIGTAVRGAVSGMSLTGGILPGDFKCSPPGLAAGPDSDAGGAVSIGSIRIPRQHPDSQLMLDIVMEDNVLRTFSLGSYLQKAGYDWTAPDLADITVHMDLSVSEITFSYPGLCKPISLTVDI